MTTYQKLRRQGQGLVLALLGILLAGAGCGSSNSAPPPGPKCVARPSGLVSWWKGESNAKDALGAYNGTINGNVTFAAAEVKQGFVFDGASFVDMGTVSGTQLDVGTSDFNIEFWMKTTSNLDPTGDGQFIVGDAAFGQAPGFRVLYQPSVNHQLRFRIADSVNATVADTAPVNDGNWHHFAFVRSAGTLTAYEDGAVAASVATAITDITVGNPTEFHLGGRSFDWFSEGSLDEVSFYNRALTATEISGIFAAGANGKC